MLLALKSGTQVLVRQPLFVPLGAPVVHLEHGKCKNAAGYGRMWASVKAGTAFAMRTGYIHCLQWCRRLPMRLTRVGVSLVWGLDAPWMKTWLLADCGCEPHNADDGGESNGSQSGGNESTAVVEGPVDAQSGEAVLMVRTVWLRTASKAAVVAVSVMLGVSALPAWADTAASLVVNCFDETRNVVQKTRRGECRGRVVSSDEAMRIEAARREYVRRAFDDRREALLPGKTLMRIGTGFFVDREGAVVTSRHVVENCETITVSPTTGNTLAAELIGYDQINDLALLRTDAAPPGIARFVQSRSAGVAMVGYPDQGIPPIRPLLTLVEMIGTETIVPGLTVLKLNGDVRPGNSGGPLLDQKGNVVGVVFAEINTPGIYAQTGEVVRNIGFAIPGDVVTAFISRWQIPYWKGRGAAEAVAEDLLAQARPYIVRIGCWEGERQSP